MGSSAGRRCRAGLALAGLLVGGTARAADPGDETRERMHGIFVAFATLLGRAQDPAVFSDPHYRAEIAGALSDLVTRTRALESHTGSLNAGHSSVRRSLVDDAALAQDAYAEGLFEAARFRVGQLADDCFACHSKLPSDHRFDLGARLLESEPVVRIPLESRALVAVAARQFEAALALDEALFRDSSRSATEIGLSGAFERYLKVALRVTGDGARARTHLEAFLGRPDVPRYLADDVAAWAETLAGLSAEDFAVAPERRLASAREWIREAQLRTAYPGDLRGLVHSVMASWLLHLHLDEQPAERSDLAETFYLLGLCEIQISPSLWVSEVEDFLEGAIRTAPETSHAGRAYATLEAVYTRGFTGSSGTFIPPEIERRLASLRALVDAAQPARANGPADAAQGDSR